MISIHHRPDQIGGRCPMLTQLRCTTLTSLMLMHTHLCSHADWFQHTMIATMIADASADRR